MKITESNNKRFATIEGIECRLTTRSRSREAKVLKKMLKVSSLKREIDESGIYRDTTGFFIGGTAILLPSRLEKVKKIMKKLGYTEYDVDSHTYPLVKMFR